MRPARAFAARPSPSAAASEFQLRADGSGAKVGVRATAATTSSPAVTRPMTTLAPSSDGTGPGPVVMRKPVKGARGGASSSSSADSASDTVPGARCVRRKAEADASSGLGASSGASTSPRRALPGAPARTNSPGRTLATTVRK
jgi:hypothetical protein